MREFFLGFLYFFGLNDNPMMLKLRKRREESDSDRLSGDWYNVGNDIRKAYEATQKEH